MIGYDANALYLWAIAQAIPTGKHEHVKTDDLKHLKRYINNKLFGNIFIFKRTQPTCRCITSPGR
jgi:hypothetical protein